MSNDLTDLLERVKAATGPNMELDRALVERFGKIGPNGVPFCAGILGIAPFSSSVDAVLALIEQLLPGWGCEVGRSAGSGAGYVRLFPGDSFEGNAKHTSFGHAPTPSLALCGAFLSTLIAKQAHSEVGNG